VADHSSRPLGLARTQGSRLAQLLAIALVAVACSTQPEAHTPPPTATPAAVRVPADVIGDELPPLLPTPDGLHATAAERVISELLGAWWFPPQPLAFAELAAQTDHLTTAEWAQEWADAPAGSPLLTDQTTRIQVLEVATTSASNTAAQVSVVVEQDGRARSYLFDLVDDGDGWRVDGVQ